MNSKAKQIEQETVMRVAKPELTTPETFRQKLRLPYSLEEIPEEDVDHTLSELFSGFKTEANNTSLSAKLEDTEKELDFQIKEALKAGVELHTENGHLRDEIKELEADNQLLSKCAESLKRVNNQCMDSIVFLLNIIKEHGIETDNQETEECINACDLVGRNRSDRDYFERGLEC